MRTTVLLPVSISLLYLQLQCVKPAKLRVKPLGYDWNDNGQSKQDFTDLDVSLSTDHVTSSGFSSGGFMTANLLVMFPSSLRGGASIAATGPCAGAGECGAKKQEVSQNYATEGLRDMRVYVWGGSKDRLMGVRRPKFTADYFKQFTPYVKEDYGECGHVYQNALPPSPENPKVTECVIPGFPNTGVDIAGKSLSYIMQEEMLDQQSGTTYNSNGQLYQIDISQYLSGDHRMLDYAYIYIPDKCFNTNCKVHLWWHGCGGTAGNHGSKKMRSTGVLEHASANEFIAIFPQVWDPQPGSGEVGFKHCWRSGFQQDSRNPQVLAVRSVLKGIFDREILKPIDAISADFDKSTSDMMASQASISRMIKQAILLIVALCLFL